MNQWELKPGSTLCHAVTPWLWWHLQLSLDGEERGALSKGTGTTQCWIKHAWVYELMDNRANEWVHAYLSFIWSSLIPAHPTSPVALPFLPINEPSLPPSPVSYWLPATPAWWAPQPTASFLLCPDPSHSTHNSWKLILKPCCWMHTQGLISASDPRLSKTEVLKDDYKSHFPSCIHHFKN